VPLHIEEEISSSAEEEADAAEELPRCFGGLNFCVNVDLGPKIWCLDSNRPPAAAYASNLL
jgi:hypothetical protein